MSQVAEAALRPWTPAFVHGDLQVAHVFVDGDEVTGVLDWSEAGQGDAMYDLASLTSVYRVGSFLALGILLLTGALAYQRMRPPLTA